MRGPLVVFSLPLVFAGGVLCGYVWQEREVRLLKQEVERLEIQQEKGRQREKRLGAQLEELQHAHGAMIAEARQLQEDLEARLSRLEGVASVLAQGQPPDQGLPR